MIVANPDGDFGGMALGQFAKGLFKTWFAAAQEHELQIRAEHLLHGAQENVHPFLVHQSSDSAEERNARFLGQPDLGLEFCLHHGFGRQILRGVGVAQVRVARRLPLRVIDAIENAAQVTLAFPENSIQPAAELGRGDLSRITGADGRQSPRNRSRP